MIRNTRTCLASLLCVALFGLLGLSAWAEEAPAKQEAPAKAADVKATPAQTEAPAKAAEVKATPAQKEAPAKVAEFTWLTDYAAAKKLAAEKKVPILINFSGSDWCGWCIKLDKEVFSQPDFKTYAKDNLVLLQCDFPRSKPQTAELKKQNNGLQGQFGIKGYPTVVYVDATGKELGRGGYAAGGAAQYIEGIKKIVAKK